MPRRQGAARDALYVICKSAGHKEVAREIVAKLGTCKEAYP